MVEAYSVHLRAAGGGRDAVASSIHILREHPIKEFEFTYYVLLLKYSCKINAIQGLVSEITKLLNFGRVSSFMEIFSKLPQV